MSRPPIRSFVSDTRGTALVEFGITLPMLLVVFAVIVEGGRMMWHYQATVSGVRDATRYLARVVPSDICTTDPTGASLSTHSSDLRDIVAESSGGAALFPAPAVTVDSVTPALICEAGPAIPYRNNPAPVAVVSAQVTIRFPFSGLFTLIGGSLADVTTVVTDNSRIFGS